MAGGEPELETVRKGTPLYGQPAWWGDEDTGKMKNGDNDNMQATQGKSLGCILLDIQCKPYDIYGFC